MIDRGAETTVSGEGVPSYRLLEAGCPYETPDPQGRPLMSKWFDAEEHADRALEMYERGRWAEAEAELRKAIALNPDQPEWHRNATPRP